MFKRIFLNFQQSFVFSCKLRLNIYFIVVSKLSTIYLNISSNQTLHIYDGPLLGEHFIIWNFQRTTKLTSFQCIVINNRDVTLPNFLIKYHAKKSKMHKIFKVKLKERISLIPKSYWTNRNYCSLRVSTENIFVIHSF